ncbi:hypothetical protein LTR66_011959 [Elasticomyces elasticus]|nr:hypothetical protein LTR28_006606 [Elasticomyces elasticus]KAK4967511.1 hypothetical protein LTR66_011959 [Elasticomyces elasticus]
MTEPLTPGSAQARVPNSEEWHRGTPTPKRKRRSDDNESTTSGHTPQSRDIANKRRKRSWTDWLCEPTTLKQPRSASGEDSTGETGHDRHLQHSGAGVCSEAARAITLKRLRCGLGDARISHIIGQGLLSLSPIRNKLLPPRPSSGAISPPPSPANTSDLHATPSCFRSASTAPDFSSIPAAPSPAQISCVQLSAPEQAGFLANALPVEAASISHSPVREPVACLLKDCTSPVNPAQSSSITPTLDPSFYAHLPSLPNLAPLEDHAWEYESDFGEKVCKQYEQNLRVQTKAQASRVRKYGESVATAFPRGQTPLEARRAYEIAQDELMRRFKEEQSDDDDE